jgi:hypothetical protein
MKRQFTTGIRNRRRYTTLVAKKLCVENTAGNIMNTEVYEIHAKEIYDQW